MANTVQLVADTFFVMTNSVKRFANKNSYTLNYLLIYVKTSIDVCSTEFEDYWPTAQSVRASSRDSRRHREWSFLMTGIWKLEYGIMTLKKLRQFFQCFERSTRHFTHLQQDYTPEIIVLHQGYPWKLWKIVELQHFRGATVTNFLSLHWENRSAPVAISIRWIILTVLLPHNILTSFTWRFYRLRVSSKF